jgi:hypothetical protein
MLFAMETGATLVPGLTPLRLGDVIDLDGELCVVDYVNDCRARVRPVLAATVQVKTRFGKEAQFERASRSVNIARNVEREAILERLGEAGLKKLLASRTARRSESDGGPATESETNERITTMAAKLRALKGEKKTRKPRGGLAADMAAEGASSPAEAKPKRGRKA